jgi:hypothetical protein
MTPLRIQRRRTKGWKLPPNTASVTRPGKFGNPFNLKSSSHCWTALHHGFKADARGRQACSVAMFEAWVRQGKARIVECKLVAGKSDEKQVAVVSQSPLIKAGTPPTLYEVRAELHGKNLACWCRLCAVHKDGKPLGVECADCDPCHADVLLKIANEVM